MLEGPRADSEEKHEPASDADAAVVDSLKALDLNRPIREADINLYRCVPKDCEEYRRSHPKCYGLETEWRRP